MKKKLLICVLLVTLLTLFFSASKFLKKFNQYEKTPKYINLKEDKIKQINTFPLKPIEDRYSLACLIEDIIFYRSFQNAPRIPGGWISLSDIKCSYFDANNQRQTIYLPLHFYHQENQEILLINTAKKIVDPATANAIISSSNLENYQKIYKKFYNINFDKNFILMLDLSFPRKDLAENDTQGAAFETLADNNPPYTQIGLEEFYKTGNPHFLPKVNKHYYFWPIVSLGFINEYNY